MQRCCDIAIAISAQCNNIPVATILPQSAPSHLFLCFASHFAPLYIAAESNLLLKQPTCFSSFTTPVLLSLSFLFMNKIIAEGTMSSANIITKYRFGWDVREVGALSALMGLLVVPVTATVGALSRTTEDRCLLKYCTVFGFFGLFLLIDFPELLRFLDDSSLAYLLKSGSVKYVVGNVIVFCSLQASESVTMSILSKVVPPALAAGTCNSGLLATEFGTLGRTLGNFCITVAGLINIQYMLNLIFIPAFLVLLMCYCLLQRYYAFLRC